MSFIKSKHSGWTWELKRTPFGGGGGAIGAARPPSSQTPIADPHNAPQAPARDVVQERMQQRQLAAQGQQAPVQQAAPTPNPYQSAFTNQQMNRSPFVQQQMARQQAPQQLSGLQAALMQMLGQYSQPMARPQIQQMQQPTQMPQYQNPALAYRPDIESTQLNLNRVAKSVVLQQKEAAEAEAARLQAELDAAQEAPRDDYYNWRNDPYAGG